jgi:hypothetical protein
MTEIDKEECEVWCTNCNCYLYSVSIYETNYQKSIAIVCPHPEKCRKVDSDKKAWHTEKEKF